MSEFERDKPGRGLPPIPPAEAANLRIVFKELALPAEAWEWLVFIVQGVRFNEAAGTTKSAPKQKNELGQVARLARQLNSALQGLEHPVKMAIHRSFKGVQIRLTLDPPDPLRTALIHGPDEDLGEGETLRDVFCENVLLLGDALLTLERVADKAAADLQGPMNGGRPIDMFRRAMHVADIAEFAAKHGLTVGRGKRFMRLAEAVFSAAGIGVSPEPAIRFFMAELLPIYSERWASSNDGDGEQNGDASG